MEKKPKKFLKKWILYGGIGLVIAASGIIFVLPRFMGSTTSEMNLYTTQTVEKGSLTSTVSATGNVYTSQTASLTWQTSGIVDQVYVSKGQQVAAGTILAELVQTSLPQSVINAASDLAAAQKELEDLLSSDVARANAELALIQAEQDLLNAQKAAQSKQFQRASQETIDIARANLIMAQDALDKAADIYNKNKNSSSNVQYANALSQFASAQQKFEQAQNNLYYVQGLPDSLEVQEAMAKVDLAQATYLDAKRAWERVKDGPNPADVAAAEAKVASAQAILDQAYVKAPITGMVTAIRVKPGDLVSAGSAAFQIDDMSHLYTDISVSEVDINSVEVGQPAAITFDAIPDKTYEGKVTDIDMVGTISSGAVSYNVTVEITNPDAQIRPGMTASADITVMQLTDVLLVPSSAIRTVNNRQVVYILQNGSLQAVLVTIGHSDDTSSEVIGGNLKEGDLLVLNPPSTTSTSTTGTRQGGLFGGLFGGIFSRGEPPGGAPPSGGPSGSSGRSSGGAAGN